MSLFNPFSFLGHLFSKTSSPAVDQNQNVEAPPGLEADTLWIPGEECQNYQACSIKDILGENNYISFKNSLPNFSFPEYIVITTKDYRDSSPISFNKSSPIAQKLVSNFCDNIKLMNKIPTGQSVLKILDSLLGKTPNNFHLQISFCLEDSASPSCSYSKTGIADASGNTAQHEINTIKIKLPESAEKTFYGLPFYNKQTGQVINFPEPSFLVLLHESAHGIQNLAYDVQITPKGLISNNIEGNILRQIPNTISTDETWIKSFFSSAPDEAEFLDELQVMVSGLKGTINEEEVVISEAKAVTEFLSNEELLSNEQFENCREFKNCKLYPFGHGIKEPTLENVLRLNRLIDLLEGKNDPNTCISLEGDFPKNFLVKDVPNDGNCGVWALMQAMDPNKTFSSPTEEQYTKMAKLRTDASAQSRPEDKNRIGTVATNAMDSEHKINPSDFEYFAQLPEISKPITIINFNGSFETYNPDGTQAAGQLSDVIGATEDSQIFLLYNGTHYQALTKGSIEKPDPMNPNHIIP